MKKAVGVVLMCLLSPYVASVEPPFQSASWSEISVQLDPDVAEAIEELRSFACSDCYLMLETWCGYLDPGPLDQFVEEINKIQIWWAEELVRWHESHGETVAMEKDRVVQKTLQQLAAKPELFHRCVQSIGHTRIDSEVD
jgi:hypothetical protein